jgi:hypothetical protein
MRAMLLVIAAAVAVMACTGQGPAAAGKPGTARLVSPHTVGCDQTIPQEGPPSGRLVLGVLTVPPAHLEQGAPTGTQPWGFFSKYGIAIRANSPAVLITVPEAWRHRAAIGWGNNVGGVSSIRLLSCPRQLGPWNAYAGGFYLLSASGCVPLVFDVGRQTAILSFVIGNGRCGRTASMSS